MWRVHRLLGPTTAHSAPQSNREKGVRSERRSQCRSTFAAKRSKARQARAMASGGRKSDGRPKPNMARDALALPAVSLTAHRKLAADLSVAAQQSVDVARQAGGACRLSREPTHPAHLSQKPRSPRLLAVLVEADARPGPLPHLSLLRRSGVPTSYRFVNISRASFSEFP